MHRILVTRKLPSSVIARLEQVGTVDLHSADAALQPAEFVERARECHAIVSMLNDRVDATLLDAATSLRVVSNVAVGYNNIDVPYARTKGVIVTNTPDVLTESLGDFTWALILSITRRLAEGDRVVRRGAWKGWAFDYMLGTELRGKQLGLVGLGRIGRAVAARAAAFGVRVAFSSRRDTVLEGAERMSLDRLLNTSDIVSIHVPLSEETRHLIDQTAIARMKRSAYLINTSRGPVIDEAALAWALQQRLLAGAALDVYEHEPVVHPDLLTLENVLLVPHLGSGTTETRTAMADLAASNVVAVLSGQPPLTPVLG